MQSRESAYTLQALKLIGHNLKACTNAYLLIMRLLPIHQRFQAQVILLNLQPSPQLNYALTNTGEWLANCGACPIPNLRLPYIVQTFVMKSLTVY